MKSYCAFLLFISAMLANIGVIFSPDRVFAENTDSPQTVIDKNLSLSMNDPEVLHLQRVLNASGFSPVAQTGPGSKGNETSYFGVKTLAAVIKFQENFSSEILAPIGLTKGTGFVGERTRAKMNTLWASSYFFSYYNISVTPPTITTPDTTQTQTTNTTSTNNNGQTNTTSASVISTTTTQTTGTSSATTTASVLETDNQGDPYKPGKTFIDLLNVWKDTTNKVKVYEINPRKAKRGDEILIAGAGFTATGNTVVLTGKTKTVSVKNLGSNTSNGLTFTVPQEIESGVSTVSVSNSSGTSVEASVRPVQLTITSTTSCTRVCINSVDQKGRGINTEFVVKGSGFTDSKNLVMSRFGPIGMYDSQNSGTIINIKLIESGVIANALPNLTGDVDFPIVIANKNGSSKFFTVTVSMK